MSIDHLSRYVIIEKRRETEGVSGAGKTIERRGYLRKWKEKIAILKFLFGIEILIS